MNKFILLVKDFLLKNKFLCGIVALYLIVRLINLTAFPLFNDESIYLDWGIREINHPGYLYYSLYDAKQPLLMWAFGIMENLLSDPVFAGRLVSVFAGFLTLLGLYKLSKYLFNQKTGLIASLIYIFIPLFSFYDRQALMESAVVAVGVWSAYFLVKSIVENKYRDFIFLGITLGIGYFIKSSPLVFLLVSYFLIIFAFRFVKNKERLVAGIIILSMAFFAAIFLLIIQPSFWQTLSTNSRFSLSVSEILGFPIKIWFGNLQSNLQVMFFYVTPVVLLLGVGGLFLSAKIKSQKISIAAIFFLISLAIETLITRNSIDRYVCAFLPLIIVFAAIMLTYLIENKKFKKLGLILISFAILISLPVTLLQVYNQADYFIYYGKISGLSYYNYLDSFTTGYGLDKVFDFLNVNSKQQRIVVGIGLNTGNPENAILVYYNKNPNVKVIYFDSRVFPPAINNFGCISTGFPTFFVSRENQLVGLDKFWENVEFVKDPYGKNTTGIYRLKTNCKGQTALINLGWN